jgi:uncharacterized protein (DUF58 family)
MSQPVAPSSGVRVTIDELIQLQALAKKITWLKQARPARGLLGHQSSRALGQGMEFQECRPYHPGDDIRHIHWRITARTEQPYRKIYAPDHERPLCLVLDLNPTLYFGTRQHFKSVLAIKLASTLAWAAHQQQERVASLIHAPIQTPFFPPQKTTAALLQLLNALDNASELHATTSSERTMDDLFAALQQHRNTLPSGSLLCIFTDAHQGTDYWHQALVQLSPRYPVHFFHLHDPIESCFLHKGFYPVKQNERTFLVNMQSDQHRQNHLDQFNQKQQALKRSCEQLGVFWHAFSTDDAWQQKLVRGAH